MKTCKLRGCDKPVKLSKNHGIETDYCSTAHGSTHRSRMARIYGGDKVTLPSETIDKDTPYEYLVCFAPDNDDHREEFMRRVVDAGAADRKRIMAFESGRKNYQESNF